MAFVNPTRPEPDANHPIPFEGVSVRLSERENGQDTPCVYCYIGEGLANRMRVRIGDYLLLEIEKETKRARLVFRTKEEEGRKVTAGGGPVEPKQGTTRNCFIQVPFQHKPALNSLFPEGPGRFNVKRVEVAYEPETEAIFSYDCEHQRDARQRKNNGRQKSTQPIQGAAGWGI